MPGFLIIFGAIIVAGALAYFFSSARRCIGTPKTLYVNPGTKGTATFTLKRKRARSFSMNLSAVSRDITLNQTSTYFSHRSLVTPPVTSNGTIKVEVTGISVGQGFLEATGSSTRTGKSYKATPIEVHVVEGYDVKGHPPDKWIWTDRGSASMYELKNSSERRFVCTEYTFLKLTWNDKKPISPRTDDSACNTEDIVQDLENAGFERVEGSQCGCEENKNKHCAVLYIDRDSQTVTHGAAFDVKLCDWGGKLAGDRPIVRFKGPHDYVKTFHETELNKMELRYYCLKDGARIPDYISDEDLYTHGK